jgi:hypothetical protein
MGRKILFVLGLVSAAYGGWMVHHEGAINARCNADVANPGKGFTISSQCLNIVWPYSEGFLLLIFGAIFVFAGLMLTRRVMAGEHQYMKDLKAGKYNRENDHLNAYNFNIQIPNVRIGARSHPGGRYYPHDE